MGIFTDLQDEQVRQQQQLAASQSSEVLSGDETPVVTDRTTERSNERASDRPNGRLTRRYSFEFYHDQIVQLKQRKHQSEEQGQFVSLSEMVRQAVDDFLKSEVA